MEYKHEILQQVVDELNYTPTPLFQTAVESDGCEDIIPQTNPPTGDQPLIFEIPARPNQYYDMDNSYIAITVKITNADGSALADDAVVGPINLLPHTMWRSVRTSISNQDVSPTDNYYAYKAFMAHLITHSKDMNVLAKLNEGFEWDAPLTEYASADKDKNTGFASRAARFAKSEEVEYQFRPADAIWNQGGDILPRFRVKLQLDRAPDSFCLMSPTAGANYKLVITASSLRLAYKIVLDEVHLQHRKQMDTVGITMMLNSCHTKLFSVPSNCSSHIIPIMFTGPLPPMLIFGLVNSEHCNGTYASNPLYFNNYGLEEVELKVNGSINKAQPIKVKFDTTKKKTLGAYNDFLKNCGALGPLFFLDINRETWETAANLWVFETKPFAKNLNVVPATGAISLTLRFSKPTEKTLSLLVSGKCLDTVTFRDDLSVQYNHPSG